MVNPEHPKDRDDLEGIDVKDTLDDLKKQAETIVKAIGEMYLVLEDEEPELVDYDELPEDEKEKHRFNHRREKLSRGDDLSKNARESSYRGKSSSEIADRAGDNPYILGDVLADPGLVDADSSTEAVAKIADQNPGWAKVSDAVEAHGLEADADGNVTPAGEGEAEGGEAGVDGGDTGTSAAEAASDAASYSGDVSTADAGDLGPTGPSGYGLDGSSGGDAGGTSGGGTGGDGGGGSGSGGGAGDGGIDGGAGGDGL
jgi:hypothetical protein